MVRLLYGTLNKKSMNTTPFNPEMRTLANVMIHNLYPITNLTTLSAPRTIFLYNLFTHKEINICGHIFHLLNKSIEKRKTRLKVLSDLTIVQRDYPIGANTVTRSKAHITGSKTGISQVPKDHVEEEGGDTEDEIDRFTSTPKSSAQPSSQA